MADAERKDGEVYFDEDGNPKMHMSETGKDKRKLRIQLHRELNVRAPLRNYSGEEDEKRHLQNLLYQRKKTLFGKRKELTEAQRARIRAEYGHHNFNFGNPQSEDTWTGRFLRKTKSSRLARRDAAASRLFEAQGNQVTISFR